MKDKNKIINEMVLNAADVMDSKSEELSMLADLFDAKGETERAAYWRKKIPAIQQAVALMRENAGCWA